MSLRDEGLDMVEADRRLGLLGGVAAIGKFRTGDLVDDGEAICRSVTLLVSKATFRFFPRVGETGV